MSLHEPPFFAHPRADVRIYVYMRTMHRELLGKLEVGAPRQITGETRGPCSLL
jgi:hypothetical protein